MRRSAPRVAWLAVGFLAVLHPASVTAQFGASAPGAVSEWPAGALVPDPAATTVQSDGLPSPARLAVGGVLGGAAGLFGLGFLGAWIADRNAGPGEDLAAVGGFALGGLVGEVLGVAGGVHLADGRRGSFWTDLGVSALGAGATLGVLALADDDGASAWTVAGVGVALQVGLTVRTELGTR